ncbi:MAG: hypothetical protein GC200_08120 [Tepidisphaera sp.]|nr:hypothetical protein [Tepidisphaera sp.]
MATKINLAKGVVAKSYQSPPAKVEDLRPEQGFVGMRFKSGAGPNDGAPVAPGEDTENTLKPPGYLEIMWFGKMHYISPAMYKKDADLYNQYHWKEALILLDSVHGNERIYQEFDDTNGFFEWATQTTVYYTKEISEEVKSWFVDVKKAPKPNIQRFWALSQRCIDVLDAVNKSELRPQALAANGIELALIREDLRRLLQDIQRFRDDMIGSAEHVQRGLETVESTAFQVLNVVPTITMMDPFREAAYKITMLLVRASARGVGGATAYGTKEAAWAQAWGILKQEGPGVVIDIIMLPVNRLMKNMGWGDVARADADFVIRTIFEFGFGLGKVALQAKDHKLTRDDVEQQLVQTLSTLIGESVRRLFKIDMTTGNAKVALASVCESVAKVLTTDIYQAIKIAEDQDREIVEVMLTELPSTIMKVAEATFVGFVQRKGSQMAEYGKSQRLSDSDSAKKAKNLLENTTVTEAWNGKLGGRGVRLNRAEQARVGFLTRPQYDEEGWRRDTNLEYETVAHLRRYADECQVWAFFRKPNAGRLNHTDSPEQKGAKLPKPMTVHTKSADDPGLSTDLQGLVMKPKDGPPGVRTHKNYDSAMAGWNKYVHELRNAGGMVRQDGLAFHPDMVIQWGKLQSDPKLAQEAARSHDTLIALQKKGVLDLSDYNNPDAAKLEALKAQSPGMAKAIDDANAFLASAKIGYYSDLDAVDFVDAKTGNSLHFGNKPNEAVDIAAENRRMINSYITKDLRGKDVDPRVPQSTAPGESGSPTKRDEKPLSEVQHGASAQMEGKGVIASQEAVKVGDGDFAVGPGGKKVVFRTKYTPEELAKMSPTERETKVHEDIMNQWTMFLREQIGADKVKDQVDRINSINKTYKPLATKIKKVKATKPFTVLDLKEARQITAEIVIIEEDGLGQEVTDLQVANSLVYRRLKVDTYRLVRFQRDLWRPGQPQPLTDRQFQLECEKNDATVGLSEDEQNIVIAVRHYRQTLAEAVAQLVRVRRALGNLPMYSEGAQLKLWFEIYTAYNPFTVDYVRDRLGAADPGLPDTKGLYNGLETQAPVFKKDPNKLLYAFAVGDMTPTYTPPIKGAGRFQGQRLISVMEDQKTLKLSRVPCDIQDGGDSRPIVVFSSPIADDTKLIRPMPKPRKRKPSSPSGRGSPGGAPSF